MSQVSNHNFMLADFAGVAVAFLLFSCLTVLPGYTLGSFFNILRFRQREAAFRLAIAVPLAIAVGPILSFLTGRAAWPIYIALSLPAIPLMLKARRRPTIPWPVFAWCAIALLALSDLQIGHRLYFSIIGFDYAIRTAFVSSISTFGLPAQNPFFYPGAPVGLRYHYYWLIQSALVQNYFSDARQSLIAGTLWCGIGLLSTVALFLRFFKIKGRKSSIVFASALLLVTGLDILPALLFLVLYKCHLIGNLPPSLEWWNDQVDGWLYSVLFEPHYVAGLIACLFGFLLISKDRRLLAAVIAGFAFATSVGAAIYVGFVFAIFLVIWSAVALWKRWFGEFKALCTAGSVAFTCSLPFLASLRGLGSGGAFLHWTVRPFFIVHNPLANLLLLPLNYFLELGLFFAIAVLEWRRIKRTTSRDDLALGIMALTSIVVCTFLRSGVISNNDLGWRGFLIAQFALLIRGAQLLYGKKLKGLAVLAALGFAGTIYDEALLRFYPVLSDSKVLPKVNWLARDEKLGDRTYANREAYEWLRAHSSAQDRVQQNPNQVIQDSFYGLYANRSTLAEDQECLTTFGGDPKNCVPLQKILVPVFAAHAADSACDSLPMDFVVVKDTDPAWITPDSWIWKRTPEYANSFVRVFRCPNKFSQSQSADPPFRR